MKQLTLGKISLEDLQAIVSLRARGIRDYDWTSVAELSLDAELTTKAQGIQRQLLATQVHLLNEATIWARGVYPLLSLAEQGPSIQAWAEVSLTGKYPTFEITGIADGAIGRCVSSLTVETSREYSEKNDAVLILKLLRSIVSRQAALWNEEDLN